MDTSQENDSLEWIFTSQETFLPKELQAPLYNMKAKHEIHRNTPLTKDSKSKPASEGSDRQKHELFHINFPAKQA